MDNFIQHFEAAIPDLKNRIITAFAASLSEAGYRSVWEHFEDIINLILINFLRQPPLSVPEASILVAKSKSVYPDLKVTYQNKEYAIDVKSGENHINPWYDIGRLDTYTEKHLDKYAAEYCVTVRWAGRPIAKVIDVYIEPTYKSVGFRSASNGVLYRPYDGKLRPKTWLDFEVGKTYWRDISHFRQGLQASQQYRQRALIVEWYKAFDNLTREQVLKDLGEIDAGKSVTLDRG